MKTFFLTLSLFVASALLSQALLSPRLVLAAEEKKEKADKKDAKGDKEKKDDKKDKKGGKDTSSTTLKAFSPKTDITSPLYVVMDELIIPVIQYRQIKGFLAGTLVIDCKTEAVANKIKTYLPIFRDRIFWDLYNLFGVIWAEDYQIDFPSLKERVKKTVLATWPDADINDVLIMDFHQISKNP